MAKAAGIATTQRAYTLRLRGIDKNDNSWREALWATHLAVNKGAKVFGEWLLTLRGGLDHRLADDGPETRCKDRRILLALSWLSVESSREPANSFTQDQHPDLRAERPTQRMEGRQTNRVLFDFCLISLALRQSRW